MKIKKERGMLFLFDAKDSTKSVHESDDVEQNIYYDLIKMPVKNVLINLESLGHDIQNIKSTTGDGVYLFSKNPEDVLLLYMELTKAFMTAKFKNDNIKIRCGAGYGNINLIGEPPNELQGDLANVVSRCCSNSNSDELVITDTLYNLIKSSTLIEHLNIEIEEMKEIYAKGCEDLKLYKLKKNKIL